MIWKTLYNVAAVPVMKLALLLAGIFSPKVRRGIKGRLGEGDRLRLARSRCEEGRPRILVHCASAGELESAVPLMEELKRSHGAEVLLSYFSPSAVDRATRVGVACDHFYLPVDTLRRVRRLLTILEPSLIVFVKHDIWPNLVWEARRRSVPTALVNGNFRPDSKRLKRAAIPFGRSVLPQLSAIYAVARDDARRFRFLAGSEAEVVAEGDTRFDRVRQRAQASREDQGDLAAALEGRPVVVAGSTWPPDEALVIPAFAAVRRERPDAVLVLAPHEPLAARLSQIENACEAAELMVNTLTELEAGVPVTDVILVDRVGVLAGLYGLGRVAYVGGGFGVGVHSVLEPAVFGLPVLFGPNHRNSHEARDLAARDAAEVVHEREDVRHRFADALGGGDQSRRMGRRSADYVDERTDVTPRLARRLAALAGIEDRA